MIITSNRALEEWPPLFVDELLASAAMDRVMHHAHVAVIERRSFRQPKSASGGSTQAVLDKTTIPEMGNSLDFHQSDDYTNYLFSVRPVCLRYCSETTVIDRAP